MWTVFAIRHEQVCLRALSGTFAGIELRELRQLREENRKLRETLYPLRGEDQAHAV